MRNMLEGDDLYRQRKKLSCSAKTSWLYIVTLHVNHQTSITEAYNQKFLYAIEKFWVQR